MTRWSADDALNELWCGLDTRTATNGEVRAYLKHHLAKAYDAGRGIASPQPVDAMVSTDGLAANADDNLRMVAIFRADLDLPVGKLAVQAGHAFLTAWRNFARDDPRLAANYAEASQTKIVLVAPDLATLEGIAVKAQKRGVPHALITDAARTVLPEPTVTVLGLGPMSKTNTNALTRGLAML